MEPRLKTTNLAQIKGKKIKEQGTLILSVERDHLTLIIGTGLLVDILDISCFTA
jgi:hypothetical protein